VQAKELLEAGNLVAAIEQLNHEVRSHPTDAHRRTFLFELLCFAGDYQRAARQLDVLAHQSVAAEVGVQVYRNVLAADEARHRLFTQGLRPHFLFPPPAYVHFHLEAIEHLCQNQPVEAKALLEQSEGSRPRLMGRLAGQAFGDFRDSDDLLGPFLEVFVHNNYVWFPFAQIKHLTIPPPQRLRDLLWIATTLEAHSGPVGEVFLPVLYAGSSAHADNQIKLGRMTDWQDAGEGLARGLGQRVFLMDGDDRALLEVREIAFEPEANAEQAT
jgi:type VI secretion system protein ImpE